MSIRGLLFSMLALSSMGACGASYYIDNDGGDNGNDGLSPERAWKTLARLSAHEAKPGDRFLFKRGCMWRGKTLDLKSGEEGNPVVYGNYGEGALPIIQPSVAFDDVSEWTEVLPGIWRTPEENVTIERLDVNQDLRASDWSIYTEPGADVSWSKQVNNGQVRYRISCAKRGKVETNIQFLGPDVPKLETSVLFRFKARSDKACQLPEFRVMRKGTPWTAFAMSSGKTEISSDWKEYEVLLMKHDAVPVDARLNIFVGTSLPEGGVLEIEPLELVNVDVGGYQPIKVDVGNIIFNHGEAYGWKKWGVDKLTNERDYYHDWGSGCVYLKSKENPANAWESIEMALKRHGVHHGGAHDVVVDGIHVRYSAAHGFGGGSCKRIVIRNCDVSWIGGGVLYTRNGVHTRYGNGIEFWCAAEDCLVENNRIWQVYDVAISNQGNDKFAVQKNITYRNNLIWSCEQSYEYWRSPETALTENVSFVNNTCLDAGFGWSHDQRPNKIGTHVLAYHVVSQNKGIFIKDNVFCNAKDSLITLHNDWLKDLDMDYNLWWQESDAPFFRMRMKDGWSFLKTQLEECRAKTGQDKHSVFGKPEFVDSAAGDYRLKPGTLGTKSSSTGGVVGLQWVGKPQR